MVVRTLDYHAEGMGSNSTLDNVTICKFYLQNESKVVDLELNLPRIKNLMKKKTEFSNSAHRRFNVSMQV